MLYDNPLNNILYAVIRIRHVQPHTHTHIYIYTHTHTHIAHYIDLLHSSSVLDLIDNGDTQEPIQCTVEREGLILFIKLMPIKL